MIAEGNLPINMAGECFDKVWSVFVKENKQAWWSDNDRNGDIDEVVDENMAEQAEKKSPRYPYKEAPTQGFGRVGTRPDPPRKDNKKTGNSTMDRMIARAKGDEPPRKQSPRKPVELSETLSRLHAKVKKD